MKKSHSTRNLLTLALVLAIVLAFTAFLPEAALAAPPPTNSNTSVGGTANHFNIPLYGDIELRCTSNPALSNDPLEPNQTYEIVYRVYVDSKVRNLEFYASQLPSQLTAGQDASIYLEISASNQKTTRRSRNTSTTTRHYVATSAKNLSSNYNLTLQNPRVTADTNIRSYYDWYDPSYYDASYHFKKSGVMNGGMYYDLHLQFDTYLR